jgi:DNA-binding NarL/FixJ family response regulator
MGEPGNPGIPPVLRASEPATIGGMGRTVLIVDDFAPFRAMARALLEADGFEVVGEAVDGVEARASVRALRPEIVLLDVQLPGEDGFAVAAGLAGDVRVVMTSSREQAQYRRALALPGAPPFIATSQLSGAALAAALAG